MAYRQVDAKGKSLENSTKDQINAMYIEYFGDLLKPETENPKPEPPKPEDDPFGGLGEDDSDIDDHDDDDVIEVGPDTDVKGLKKKLDEVIKVKTEEEKREKNRNQIFEDVQDSIKRIEIFINKLKDNSNSFDKRRNIRDNSNIRG